MGGILRACWHTPPGHRYHCSEDLSFISRRISQISDYLISQLAAVQFVRPAQSVGRRSDGHGWSKEETRFSWTIISQIFDLSKREEEVNPLWYLIDFRYVSSHWQLIRLALSQISWWERFLQSADRGRGIIFFFSICVDFANLTWTSGSIWTMMMFSAPLISALLLEVT